MNSKSNHKKKKVENDSLNESLNIDEEEEDQSSVDEKKDFKEIFSFENIEKVLKTVESLKQESIS